MKMTFEISQTMLDRIDTLQSIVTDLIDDYIESHPDTFPDELDIFEIRELVEDDIDTLTDRFIMLNELEIAYKLSNLAIFYELLNL